MTPTSGAGAVLRESAEGVATLTLDRAPRRNALTSSLVGKLRAALAEADGDHSVRVIAIRGAGKDFCAGADVEEIAASQEQGPEVGLADAQHLGGLFQRIRHASKPVVAVVHGRALGGGCGLATACDVVLASEAATFGYPEVHLGFVPALVLAMLKKKVGEAAAFELVVRGHRIDAQEAVSIGLATRVIPDAAFGPTVENYLRDLASRPPGAVALTKRHFHAIEGDTFDDAIARGAEVNAVARLTDECRDGVRRFLRKSTS